MCSPYSFRTISVSFFILLLTTYTSAMAAEFNYGQGKMILQGGFLGLQGSVKEDITTYSLKAQHNNLFGSKVFYNYRLSWYDSKKMVNAQQTLNSTSIPGLSSTYSLPKVDYRLQGLDVNLSLGYDFIHQGERDFLGLGLLLGLSTPWINSNKSRSDDSFGNLSVKDTKTELWTYKIGPMLVMRKSLNTYFSLYGSLSYAFQTAHVKNTKLNLTTDVDGNFSSYDFGVRFQPISADYKWGWLTLSPRLYATAGIRHSQWTVKDMAIDISGQNFPLPKSDLKFKTDTYYLGFGYDF